MEQRGLEPRARHCRGFIPKSLTIAAERDGQDARLLAQHLADLPAHLLCIATDFIAVFGRRDAAGIAVTGVLDQHGVGIEGQRIKESITVILILGCIHDDRAAQLMRFGELHDVADKFLKAHIQVGARRGAAAIDHSPGRQ